MDIFVELTGASGATYRFRAWPEDGQSPIAGNFAVVERDGDKVTVHLVGITNSLSEAQAHALAAGLGEAPLFVRLNIARATRRQEHDDLVAQYAPLGVVDADV